MNVFCLELIHKVSSELRWSFIFLLNVYFVINIFNRKRSNEVQAKFEKQSSTAETMQTIDCADSEQTKRENSADATLYARSGK